MTKLYKKSEITFAILWIVAYVVLSSFADNLSERIGVTKSVTAATHVAMSLILFFWIKKNDLCVKYGFCKANAPAKKFLYYLPLAVVASTALWNGVCAKDGFPGTLLRVVSMCCVGFLEEVIFRGLLFRAMEKDNPKSAIIVSSLLFGLGHIVNLFNGSGQDLVSTIIQIILAVMVGFVLTFIFYYGGSLIPCILFHSANNALNAFASGSIMNSIPETVIHVAPIVVLLGGYLIYLVKTFGKKANDALSKQERKAESEDKDDLLN